MAKTLIVAYPKLEAKRAYNGHTTKTYADPTHGPEYEKFGRNLASSRVALGLSQADIAKSLEDYGEK